ncbi:polypeptide-transport-associated domain protein FtsQ-type [Clostridium sp. CAG:567]|jgi:cell division protein FtsQ|nr:polypeptide-transport-associated domain protein FtsQ-type [Clostridium sp. CAG:567]
MSKKLKEKSKNTQKDSTFNVDNEIIIGIKTLPNPEENKKKTQKRKNEKIKNTTKKSKTTKTKKKTKNKEEEFELKLGIEDEKVKPKKKKKKTKKLTKKQEIARKKRKAFLRLVKWATLILLLIGGGIGFLLSSFFNIKKIEIVGNNKLTRDEAISLSQIEIEENTFKLSKNKIEKNIKQNAYVESVKIKRNLPSTILIEIEERVPTYMITFANAYAYINNQGYFVEISKEKLELPIITGYATKEEDIQLGERLCTEDLQKLDDILQIMKAAESNEIANIVTKINISDKQDYVLELKSEKKTVHVGDTSNLSTKMLYIKEIIEQNKKIEGEILVNTDLNNKWAIFRKKV